MKTMRIAFSAQGQVKQRVTLLKTGVSAKELQDGLNSGRYVTTIQEGGEFSTHIEETSTGEKVARIDDVNNELEYSDFEVEED